MFVNPTVFVLGAGVSKDFGFPLGGGLIDDICKSNGGTTSRLVEILKIADKSRTSLFIEEFIYSLGHSNLHSIDAWLEGNKKYMSLGKCAIASIIWRAEHRSLRKSADDQNDWFKWLWNKMYTPKIKDLPKNTVSFVTFNYDRLLEHRLRESVQYTYRQCSEQQREKAFQAILDKIIHVHGVLHSGNREFTHYGRDTWVADSTLEGLDLINKNEEIGARIAFLAKSINIVSENASDRRKVNRSRKLLAAAKKIIFLGFGYDERNVDRLGLKEIVASPSYPVANDNEHEMTAHPVVGSAYGLELQEQITIRNKFVGKIFLGENTLNAVSFCRKYVSGT